MVAMAEIDAADHSDVDAPEWAHACEDQRLNSKRRVSALEGRESMKRKVSRRCST
jgi:hypothetical protein